MVADASCVRKTPPNTCITTYWRVCSVVREMKLKKTKRKWVLRWKKKYKTNRPEAASRHANSRAAVGVFCFVMFFFF